MCRPIRQLIFPSPGGTRLRWTWSRSWWRYLHPRAPKPGCLPGRSPTGYPAKRQCIRIRIAPAVLEADRLPVLRRPRLGRGWGVIGAVVIEFARHQQGSPLVGVCHTFRMRCGAFGGGPSRCQAVSIRSRSAGASISPRNSRRITMTILVSPSRRPSARPSRSPSARPSPQPFRQACRPDFPQFPVAPRLFGCPLMLPVRLPVAPAALSCVPPLEAGRRPALLRQTLHRRGVLPCVRQEADIRVKHVAPKYVRVGCGPIGLGINPVVCPIHQPVHQQFPGRIHPAFASEVVDQVFGDPCCLVQNLLVVQIPSCPSPGTTPPVPAAGRGPPGRGARCPSA